jgi:hypothetical protein
MPDDLEFLEALAAVRPGLPGHALRQIFGPRWREPLAHEQGKVLCIRHSHAFTAQIDIHGIVRLIEFGTIWADPPFSADVGVTGLRRGMSVGSAQRVYPQLTIRPGNHPMPTFGSAKLDDGTSLRLQFLFEELRVIALFDEQAVYPAKVSTPYPNPVEPPGHPFADPNFKLVVMSDLLDRHIIDLATTRELAAFVLKRPFDIEKEGYALVRPVYDYLVRFPLTPDHISAVETISFDGGLSIYPYIWPFWDGESNEFEVRSVQGLELCQNVTELRDLPTSNGMNFRNAPFRRLPKLSRLTLTIGRYSNIDGLLDLPALAECELWGNQIFADVSTPGHPSRKIMETLRARGVKLRVQYVSYPSDVRPKAFE